MPSNESDSPKIVGVPKHVYAFPLWWNVREHPGFRIQSDIPANLAINLRYHNLHCALLTPVDYARDYAMYRIIPHVAVSSKGESKTILLTFSKKLHSLETIAVDPGSTSEIVLTQLVLAEKYNIRPTFVPTTHLNKERHRFDATLLVGDPAIVSDIPNAMDIVDEWGDISGLPYIHCIWASREDDLTSSEMRAIIDAGRVGSENPHEIIRTALNKPSHEEYLSNFEFSLNEEKTSAIGEFLRMAYYHGVLQDIPDVKLHSSDRLPSPEFGHGITGSRN